MPTPTRTQVSAAHLRTLTATNEEHHKLDHHVPQWLRDSAAVAWRLLVVGAAIYFGWQLLRHVSVVVLSAIIGLFPAALLWGPVQALKRRGWRPLLATWTVLLAALLLAVGVGFIVVPQLTAGVEPLAADLSAAYDSLLVWLSEGPLGISEAEVQRYSDMLIEQLQSSAAALGTGLLSGAVAVIEVLTGVILALIVAFFVLKDGDRIRTRILERLSPAKATKVAKGSRAAWKTLNNYIKGLAITGVVDATAIAIGLLIVGVPLVLPLSMLVFFGAFFPLIGAFLSGLVAVAVAFVNGGVVDGLIVLAIVVGVQQLEGDVVMPLVFGRAMQLHPLVVLLAIAAGGVAFGIVGAFLAVPAAAVIVAVDEALAEEANNSFVSVARNIRHGEE